MPQHKVPCCPLILASGSVRRRHLLAEAGYRFTVQVPSEGAEQAPPGVTDPVELAKVLARQKAGDVARRVERGLVIGCDTLVECQGQVLGKPADRDDARRILELLRGREHRVISGLCLWPVPAGKPQTEAAITRLVMEPLTDCQLEAYLDSGLWKGKAGAFGYQDRLGWVRALEGSESNVVGLPLELLATMLASAQAPEDPQ